MVFDMPSRPQKLGYTVSRRGFLAGIGLASAATFAACSDDSPGATSSGSMDLTFSTPTDAVKTIELFKSFAADFQQQNSGSTVEVVENGAGNFDQWLQAHLAAGNAPDVLRITPTQIGPYIANGGMLDISSYLPQDYAADFNETFWAQVTAGGDGVFGIPQCVDTTALFYRKSMIDEIGARLPKSAEDAWTWDEFIDISNEVKKITGKYAFSFTWGATSGYYWLPLLYQHGGALVQEDLKTPAINNDAGIEALQWTRDWFVNGLISESNSMQGTTGDSQINLFTSGQVGMMVNGDWKLTNVGEGKLPDDDWDVTYLFRDVATASLVGGTIIGVTKDAKNPELAAQLAAAMCNEQNMREYCEQTLFLPARTSLFSDKTKYSYRPDAVQIFVKQAETIPKSMYVLQTSPNFSAMNNVLSQQIALCFTGQQSAQQTAENIEAGIKSAVA